MWCVGTSLSGCYVNMTGTGGVGASEAAALLQNTMQVKQLQQAPAPHKMQDKQAMVAAGRQSGTP
jgi:hypothetical protein